MVFESALAEFRESDQVVFGPTSFRGYVGILTVRLLGLVGRPQTAILPDTRRAHVLLSTS